MDLYLFLAIAWTIVFIADLITCLAGAAPTWVLVFCPVVCLVLDKWQKYFEEKLK